jgi:hypothetical protein
MRSAFRTMSFLKQKLSCKNLVLLGSCLGAMVLAEIAMPRISGASTSINPATPVDPMVQTTLDEINALGLTEQSPAPKAMDKSGDRIHASANIPEKTPQVIPTPIEQSSAITDLGQASQKSSVIPATAQPAAGNRSAQANLSDISGNWAEPFIRVLTDNGIIAGYPDGTFQPDRPVTRAEFAALVNKAFPDAPEIRAAINFRDVPRGFWAADAIRKATATGFLAGYPDRTFQPREGIKRIDSLVSFVNGAKITPEGQAANIDELFTDTNQVPSYGRDQLVAAAHRCVAVSVSYPDGRTFNPTGVATRADVAAFLHQTLVAAGRLPKLAEDSPAQKYIVNCAPAPAPTVAKVTEQDLNARTGVPTPPPVQQVTVNAPVNAPVGGVTTPSGFGANWGDAFIGFGSQNNIPAIGRGAEGRDSTSFGAGFGLGDARSVFGLETSYSTAGSFNSKIFNRGNVNFKLHKVLTDNLAVAVGWENAISHGYTPATDPGSTVYGVLTGVLPLGETSNITASVGAGNGRFRTSSDLSTDKQGTNLFGSIGVRATDYLAVVGDYNGRTFNVGLPLTLTLSDGVGFQVTPALLDIGGDKTSVGAGTRFGISGGLGIKF